MQLALDVIRILPSKTLRHECVSPRDPLRFKNIYDANGFNISIYAKTLPNPMILCVLCASAVRFSMTLRKS